MSVRYLTLPEILLLQELIIKRFGGTRGITEYGFGKLEAALAAPQHSMFGEDLYPDLAAKAGILFYSLIRSHCFSDGNKRTALLAMVEFLARNDAQLAPLDNDQLYEFVMHAADRLSREQTLDWLAQHIAAQPVDS